MYTAIVCFPVFISLLTYALWSIERKKWARKEKELMRIIDFHRSRRIFDNSMLQAITLERIINILSEAGYSITGPHDDNPYEGNEYLVFKEGAKRCRISLFQPELDDDFGKYIVTFWIKGHLPYWMETAEIFAIEWRLERVIDILNQAEGRHNEVLA